MKFIVEAISVLVNLTDRSGNLICSVTKSILERVRNIQRRGLMLYKNSSNAPPHPVGLRLRRDVFTGQIQFFQILNFHG